MRSLAEQLRAAREAKGWSVSKLLDESGLDCDRTSLQRKLRGEQKLTTEEAEQIATALECTLVWVPDEEAKAS